MKKKKKEKTLGSPPLLSDAVAPVFLWGALNPSPISSLFPHPHPDSLVMCTKSSSSASPLSSAGKSASLQRCHKQSGLIIDCTAPHPAPFYLLHHAVQVWSLFLFIYYFQPVHRTFHTWIYFIYSATEWEIFLNVFFFFKGWIRVRDQVPEVHQNREDGSVGVWSEK